jgi:hypothetical protein
MTLVRPRFAGAGVMAITTLVDTGILAVGIELLGWVGDGGERWGRTIEYSAQWLPSPD